MVTKCKCMVKLFKLLHKVLLFAFLILISSCIEQFIPLVGEDKDIIVVEGLITDQPGQNIIKLSISLPLGGKDAAKPLIGCIVTISDDFGNNYSLHETVSGTYIADPAFQGVVGRSYTLRIATNESHQNLSYQSSPVLMKPVPPIDSIYYDKIVLSRMSDGWPSGEGCQIYLNTHDPENICRFYRWEYVETWKFQIPYSVPNNQCWVSSNSDKINIKSTSTFSSDRIERHPINYITNTTDRLKIRYSILVNQYSLNENEYIYWEKLQNIVEQVGSLYDITPASIPSNILCIEKPNENVLGYFSVSAVKSKRIFINDNFNGIANPYSSCEDFIVTGSKPIPNLGVSVWVLISHSVPPPPYRVVTYSKGCYDCTVRGTKIEPEFWIDAR